MFKELVPVLRDRAVLLTVTLLEEDQIRVNIVPKKIKDGDNDALTTPLSVTGTADELDEELSSTLVSYAGSYLQLRNTLEKAKAEMDAAAKKAQEEARAKTKGAAKRDPPRPTPTTQAESAATPEPPKPDPKTACLFDTPLIANDHAADEEEEILAEAREEDEREEGGLDQAA
jgi:PRTRC genetic system protein E